MRLRLSDPEHVHELVQALNATDCFAARTARDTVDVFAPWLEPGESPEHAAAEILFFVRAWGAGRPGLSVRLDPR